MRVGYHSRDTLFKKNFSSYLLYGNACKDQWFK